MTGAADTWSGSGLRLEELAPRALEERPGGPAEQWDDLAQRCGSPFLSTAWLLPWTIAYAGRKARWLVLRDGSGGVCGTGCFLRTAGGGYSAAANVETSHWDVAAADSATRDEMWTQVAARAGQRLQLTPLPNGASLESLRRVLPGAGFRVLERRDAANPRLELPATWNELLASVSHNLRSQYRRRRGALARMGMVRLRVTTGGPELERDLQAFLRLEASGWKGRLGTAVLMDPAGETLYRGFAERAAASGWLRLALLEVDGRLVAGDLGCTFAGGTFMLKTAYDERLADASPGLVLRGEALRAAIEDGSSFYDFTGSAEPYKLRWGGAVQPYVDIAAYRGVYAPLSLYHSDLRPILKAAHGQLAKLLTWR